MKKNMNILLSSLVIAGLLAGCGAKTTTTSTKSNADSTRTEQSTSHKHKTSAKAAASEKKTTDQKNESQNVASQTAANETLTVASSSAASAGQASSSANTLKVGSAMVTLPETQSSKTATNSQAVAPTTETIQKAQASGTTATTQQPAIAQNNETQAAQLNEDQMTDQQKAGLLAWYTSHYVTNEAAPQANRPLVVTAMNESSVLAPLPNGTNNTYYQIYGAKPDENEWVNYYAQGKDVDGSPIADTVYIYNNQQWNPYQVSDMVNTANQNNGTDYVNQVANNVQMYDER